MPEKFRINTSMSKKLSKDIVNERLSADGRGITMMSEYQTAKIKTLFRCQNGHEWSATPDSVIHGSGCPHCSNKYSPTTDEFSQWLKLDNRGFTLTSEYTNAMSKTGFRCVHGHTWQATPHDIKNGRGCPSCSRQNQISRQSFTAAVVSEWLISDGRGITLVGDYYGSQIKTLFRCVCGNEWSATPNNIKNGNGCPSCAFTGFNPDKPAWVYGWIRDNYLKVGITNDLQRRLKEHCKHGEISLVYEQYYPIGKQALDFERKFKRDHGGSYVTKEECPDGYTETFPLHLVEELSR